MGRVSRTCTILLILIFSFITELLEQLEGHLANTRHLHPQGNLRTGVLHNFLLLMLLLCLL